MTSMITIISIGMEGIHSVRKFPPKLRVSWRLENGFCNSRLLLLVPSHSDGDLLLLVEGREGSENSATGSNELSLLLAGLRLAFPAACYLNLY